MANEQKIWSFLLGKIGNKFGVAGLMGNLYAESGLNPQNLENAYEKKLGYTDASYTSAVDNGYYGNFSTDSAGYGLAQWTYRTRKAALLNYAHAKCVSIGDLNMQLNFLWKELSESYPGVVSALKTASSVRAASDVVMVKFENPRDQSEAAKAGRAKFGQSFYDKFASAAPQSGGVTEEQLRLLVVNTISAWIGSTKGSAGHKEILSIYNNYRPLARGYIVKATDAYCATTVSAAFIKAGIASHTGTECGVEEFTKVAKARGIWVENDAHVPKLGDACVYDWQDDGKGDCTGFADHIGIVTAVFHSQGYFQVVEGNMNGGKVGTRMMRFNGQYIRGFICPKYNELATAAEDKEENEMAKIYADIKDVPSYWRKDIQELLDLDCINGGTDKAKNPTDVNLSEDTIKAIVIMKGYIDKKFGAK